MKIERRAVNGFHSRTICFFLLRFDKYFYDFATVTSIDTRRKKEGKQRSPGRGNFSNLSPSPVSVVAHRETLHCFVNLTGARKIDEHFYARFLTSWRPWNVID